jgi:hypothetical protein
VVLLLLVSLMSVGPALAQNPKTIGANVRSALPQQQGQGPTDPAELEAFLDRLFAEQMREHHIAGAAIQSGPLGSAVIRVVLMTVGLTWQFVLSMIIVYQEEGDLRWSTLRRFAQPPGMSRPQYENKDAHVPLTAETLLEIACLLRTDSSPYPADIGACPLS